ncbi:MAG TPA: IS200/IS605 family transposase [Anaerolineae bacterium]
MAYWRLHYHLVWATYKRESMIDRERERVIYGTLYQKAKELGLIIHAIGNVEDHLHTVVSIPPKIATADCVRHLKGASSHAVNQTLKPECEFKWQEGYGAISIGERSLPNVIAYASHQKQHHRNGTEIAFYERMAEEDDGPTIQPA